MADNNNFNPTSSGNFPVALVETTVTQPVSDGGSTLSIDDGGSSISVDGTITANAGTGTFAVGDGGGSLTVDDGGTSLTVDGTVTANAGTGTFTIGDGGGSLTVDGTITTQSSTGSLTNRSGSITAGGTSQQLAAANGSRKYLFIQNISTDTLWFDFGVTAVQDQPSLKLLPEASFAMEAGFISTQVVNIIGPTTGAKFVAKEG